MEAGKCTDVLRREDFSGKSRNWIRVKCPGFAFEFVVEMRVACEGDGDIRIRNPYIEERNEGSGVVLRV